MTTRLLALGAGAASVHWIGDAALFALGDGAVSIVNAEGPPQRRQAHDGAILSSRSHRHRRRRWTHPHDQC
jgi:hypothetical protein